MITILLGICIVLFFFAFGCIAGYCIMNMYYFKKKFETTAQKCMDDVSFEPLIDEIGGLL